MGRIRQKVRKLNCKVEKYFILKICFHLNLTKQNDVLQNDVQRLVFFFFLLEKSLILCSQILSEIALCVLPEAHLCKYSSLVVNENIFS